MAATRSPNDYYPTPPWCYEKLPFDFQQFQTALEPCRGDGRIYNFLKSKGLDTYWAELSEGVDYLSTPFDNVDLILTNPPFSIAEQFVEKALLESNSVVMLLRLNWLGSQKRYDFWLKNPATGLIILSKRPSFTGTGTDSTEYAWFIWDKTGKLPKGISHIK
jgi:hypothetical protein